MLSHKEVLLVMRAAQVMAKFEVSTPESRAELARDLFAMATASATAREAMAEAAASRPKDGPRGRPPAIEYTVELNPQWGPMTVKGIGAAVDLVHATLRELGVPALQFPQKGTLTSRMSTIGEWYKLMETSEGNLTLIVKKKVKLNPEKRTEHVAPKKRKRTRASRMAELRAEQAAIDAQSGQSS